MRKAISAGLVAASLCLGCALAAEPGPAIFKVGVVARHFVPSEPFDWRGDANHALGVMIWYPAASGAEEGPQTVGPPGHPLFDLGPAALDAPLVPGSEKLPLIVLSHGTGGTASSLAWLGGALARAGYVVAAVNHPGNNAIDGYTVPGFTLWWLRARDLSAVIDGMLADPIFGPRLDGKRIAAAGFSLGGYTVISVAGAITSLQHLRAFCASPGADASCMPPPEFADLIAKADALAKSDPAYRAALDNDGRSYRDARIRAVFAMAPALGPAFTPESLAKIALPVAIVAGAADKIAPVANGARALSGHIPHADLTILPGGVGHYVFSALCTETGRKELPERCADADGVDRTAIHAETASLAVAFFAAHLR